jgi:hypothetical protein
MKALKIVIAGVLILHGLIHFMGTAAYLKLAEVQGLPYKTTVLAGRWDLGEVGTAVFGVFWAIVAIGFIVAPVAWLTNRSWWRSALLAVTFLSLLLTVLDWETAKVGAIISFTNLAILWLWPLFTAKSREANTVVRG